MWTPTPDWLQKHSSINPVGVTTIELTETHQVNYFLRLLSPQEGLSMPKKGELKLAGTPGSYR
jgi:hypothetical protein